MLVNAGPVTSQLTSVSIADYKNLRNVELPWSDVTVLFGLNGSGKTNVLECLGLMFGTDRTLRLLEERAALPAPASLSCRAQVSSRHLPLPPDIAAPLAGFPDVADRLASDLRWWSSLGVTSGDTFVGCLIEAGLPGLIVDLIVNHVERPELHYTLDAMEGFAESDRRYGRILTIPAVTDELLALAADLPTPFEPLRAWIANGRKGVVGLLRLPDSSAAPGRLEWLPRLRSADEVRDDLLSAFERALPATTTFAYQLAATVQSEGEFEAEPDPSWWLHEVGAEAAALELASTLPTVSIESRGDGVASWAVVGPAGQERGTYSHGFLAALSSGERRWLDEAFATLARALNDHGRRSQWQSFAWDAQNESFWKETEALVEAGDPSAEKVLAQLVEDLPYWVKLNEFVNADDLTQLSRMFEKHIWVAANNWLLGEPTTVAGMLALVPALADLTEIRTTIRVIDEPEAHLHPAAQRTIRDALTTIGRGADQLVIATHSPYLLSHPDWRYLYVKAGSVRPLKGQMLAAQGKLARDLGLTTGELLVSTRLVLVVEGTHDREFLYAFYGDRLREAGVIVLRMHGTHNAKAALDSEFWLNYSSIPFAIMMDNVRLSRVGDKSIPLKALTDEEQTLRHLTEEMLKSKRKWFRVGLDRPDITAYIDESLLATYGKFPGWVVAIEKFRTLRTVGFKDVLRNFFGVNLQRPGAVAKLTKEMADGGLRPIAEIERHVNEICAWAQAGMLPS